MLKLYCGNNLRESENEVLKSIVGKRNGDVNHIVITPDRMAQSTELRLFDILKSNSIFDVDVAVLNKLVRKVVKDDRKLLNKSSAIAIIKGILIENNDKLKLFGRLQKYDGFCSKLYNTICMYKSCNIKYSDIDTCTKNVMLNEKLSDLKLVYEKYEEYLSDTYTDSFNRLQLLCKSIDKEIFKSTYFYFVGFTDFTPIVMTVIAKLMKYSLGVSIGLATKKDSNIYPNSLYYDLVDLAKINGIECDTIQVESSLSSVKQSMLELSKVSVKQSTTKACGQVRCRVFDSIDDEIEFAIREIIYEIKSQGLRYKDYQILCSLNDYSAISTYAKMYNLPIFIDKSDRLSDVSAIRYLLNIMNVVKNGHKADDVLSILHSEYSGLSHRDVCLFENEITKKGIRYLSADDLNDDEIGLYLSKIFALRNDTMSVREGSVVFDKLLSDINYAENLGKVSESCDKTEYRKLSQVLDKISGAINDINRVIGDIKMSLYDYFMVFVSVIDSMSLAIPPVSADAVMVADISNSEVQNSKFVYILGMNEGKYPTLIADSGMITDKDIDNQKNGKNLKPSIAMVNRQNKFKAYENLFAFDNVLNMSYIGVSQKGEKLEPAMFYRKIMKLFSIESGNGTLSMSSADIALNVDSNDLILNTCTRYGLKKNYVNLLKKSSTYGNNENFLDRIETLGSIIDQDKSIKKNFLGENINNQLKYGEELFGKEKYSVSEFESYNKCPYKHFVDYGLRLKEKPDGQIQSTDFGNILHSFMCTIVPVLNENKNANLTDKQVDDLSVYHITKILSEDYSDIYHNKYNKNIIKGIKRECQTISKYVLKSLKLSSYEPKEFEKKFVYKVDGDLILVGIIDRVDTYENDFRVIDYKSGSPTFSNYDDLASGNKLQLFVYLCAYKNMTNKTPKGAFYMPLKDAYYSEYKKSYPYRLLGVMSENIADLISMDHSLSDSKVTSSLINASTKTDGSLSAVGSNLRLSDDDFNYLMDYVIDFIKEEKQKILSGDISVSPLNPSTKDNKNMACKYCKYKGMCGITTDDMGRAVPSAKTIDDLKNIKDKE